MTLFAQLARGRFAEVFVRGDGQVLKLYREGHDAAEIRRELANAEAAHAAGIPTPRPVQLTTVGTRLGIVFERVEGPRLLDVLAARPDEADRLGRDFASLHATMHGRDAATLPSQRETLRGEIARAPDVPDATRAEALATLEALPDGAAICHGDFHPLNVVVAASGPVILDWYKATRGNPDADVARTLMLLWLTPLPRSTRAEVGRAIAHARAAFLTGYRDRYEDVRGAAREAVERWMVPVAVARLGREISPNERSQLLSVVERLRTEGAAAIFPR